MMLGMVLLISIPFIIIIVLAWTLNDFLKYNQLMGDKVMADCLGVLVLNNTDPIETVLMFENKKQIICSAFRLLYMLISRSNRIGNDIHLLHMDTKTGVEYSDDKP